MILSQNEMQWNQGSEKIDELHDHSFTCSS